MAGAAAAVSKTWHPFPGGVGDLILEYLNLEPLMPPVHLRVSKILSPIMTLPSPRATLIPTDGDEILHRHDHARESAILLQRAKRAEAIHMPRLHQRAADDRLLRGVGG